MRGMWEATILSRASLHFMDRRMGFLRADALPHTQHLGHAPRLRDASTRNERLIGVENLADRSDARVAQMRVEPAHHRPCVVDTIWMDAQPRVDEGTDEPRPHRAHVIRRVARAQVTVVLG